MYVVKMGIVMYMLPGFGKSTIYAHFVLLIKNNNTSTLCFFCGIANTVTPDILHMLIVYLL